MKYTQKYNIIILFFLLILFLSHYFAYKAERKNIVTEEELAGATSNESILKNTNIFLSKGEDPFLWLQAEVLRFDPEKETNLFSSPQGITYTQKGEQVYFVGKEGFYETKEQFLQLQGDTKITQGKSEVTSQLVQYFRQKNLFKLQGDVRSHTQTNEGDHIFINAPAALFLAEEKIGEYSGGVEGKILRKKPYEPGIFFTSQTLKAQWNLSLIELEDNVHVKKKNLAAAAKRAQIFLDNYNKKLKYYTLYDDVNVEEEIQLKDGSLVKRTAISEKLEGFMKEQKIILTGTPKVFQGNDTIKGNIITVRENTEILEVDDSNSNFTIKENL